MIIMDQENGLNKGFFPLLKGIWKSFIEKKNFHKKILKKAIIENMFRAVMPAGKKASKLLFKSTGLDPTHPTHPACLAYLTYPNPK